MITVVGCSRLAEFATGPLHRHVLRTAQSHPFAPLPSPVNSLLPRPGDGAGAPLLRLPLAPRRHALRSVRQDVVQLIAAQPAPVDDRLDASHGIDWATLRNSTFPTPREPVRDAAGALRRVDRGRRWVATRRRAHRGRYGAIVLRKLRFAVRKDEADRKRICCRFRTTDSPNGLFLGEFSQIKDLRVNREIVQLNPCILFLTDTGLPKGNSRQRQMRQMESRL